MQDIFLCTFCNKETGGYDEGAFYFAEGPVRSTTDGACCSRCAQMMGINGEIEICIKCGFPVFDPWLLDVGPMCEKCAEEYEEEHHNTKWNPDGEDDEFHLFS